MYATPTQNLYCSTEGFISSLKMGCSVYTTQACVLLFVCVCVFIIISCVKITLPGHRCTAYRFRGLRRNYEIINANAPSSPNRSPLRQRVHARNSSDVYFVSPHVSSCPLFSVPPPPLNDDTLFLSSFFVCFPTLAFRSI